MPVEAVTSPKAKAQAFNLFKKKIPQQVQPIEAAQQVQQTAFAVFSNLDKAVEEEKGQINQEKPVIADANQVNDSDEKSFPNIFKKEGRKTEERALQASARHSNIFKAKPKERKEDSKE